MHVCWGLGLSVLRVGSVTGEVMPERRRAHNACLYLVYSKETGWRWCVYMHNSNRSNWRSRRRDQDSELKSASAVSTPSQWKTGHVTSLSHFTLVLPCRACLTVQNTSVNWIVTPPPPAHRPDLRAVLWRSVALPLTGHGCFCLTCCVMDRC